MWCLYCWEVVRVLLLFDVDLYLDVLENLIYVTLQFCHLLRVWSRRRSIIFEIGWAKQSIRCNYYWSFRSSTSALSQFWRRKWARITISARECVTGGRSHSTEHAAKTWVVLVPLGLWLRNVSKVDVEKLKHSEWKVCAASVLRKSSFVFIRNQFQIERSCGNNSSIFLCISQRTSQQSCRRFDCYSFCTNFSELTLC